MKKLYWRWLGLVAKRDWTWRAWNFVETWSPIVRDGSRYSCLTPAGYARVLRSRFDGWKEVRGHRSKVRRILEVPIEVHIPKGTSVDWN